MVLLSYVQRRIARNCEGKDIECALEELVSRSTRFSELKARLEMSLEALVRADVKAH